MSREVVPSLLHYILPKTPECRQRCAPARCRGAAATSWPPITLISCREQSAANAAEFSCTCSGTRSDPRGFIPCG